MKLVLCVVLRRCNISHITFTDALEQFEGKSLATIFFTFLYFLPSETFSMNHVNSYPFHYLSAQTVVLVFFTCNNNCMSYTFAFSMCTVLNCCTLLNLAYSKYANNSGYFHIQARVKMFIF